MCERGRGGTVMGQFKRSTNLHLNVLLIQLFTHVLWLLLSDLSFKSTSVLPLLQRLPPPIICSTSVHSSNEQLISGVVLLKVQYVRFLVENIFTVVLNQTTNWLIKKIIDRWIDSEIIDMHSPCLSLVISDCTHPPPSPPPKHTFPLCVCGFLSCVPTHTQASADGGGGGGVRGFAPAPPSSAHWLSGPSEESDNTLMTGHHLPQQQQQGEAMHQPTKKKNPPPTPLFPPPSSPPPPYSSRFPSSSLQTLVCFFQKSCDSTPPSNTPTSTPYTHTFSFPHRCLAFFFSFSCCYLTSADCLWLAFHTRGGHGG